MKKKRVKKQNNQNNLSLDDLRLRAEDIIKGNLLETSDLSARDLDFILHEVQVHQVELHLQNEELRRLQLELETSRDNYANLYDFAPICYCTLDQKGVIREANRCAQKYLGLRKANIWASV